MVVCEGLLMLKNKWNLADVAAVFVLRVIIGAIMGRIILPFVGVTDYLSLQVTDSVILIVLAAVFLQWRHSSIRHMFRRGRFKPRALFGWGMGAGFFLLFLGNWSENWVMNKLLIDLGPHPLAKLALQADRAGQFVLPFVIGGFLVPAAEEVFYRGFLFPPLAEETGPRLAIILAGLIFALAHFDQSWFFEIFLVGIILTSLYRLFDSLWPCLGAHIVLNAGRLIMIYLAV